MTRIPTRAVTPAAAIAFALLNIFVAGSEVRASVARSAVDPDATLPGQGTGLSGQGHGPSPVQLGMSGGYAILAKTGISMTGTTAVTGDIGVSPAAGSYITGFDLLAPPTTFATSAAVTGKVYASDFDSPTPSNLTTAISDLRTAFTDAAGRAPDYSEQGAGSIGGMTLAPAVYQWSTDLLIPSDVTLTGGPDDVWIFQIAGNLKMESGVAIVLAGGALPKNIFWQVSGAVDLETTSHFEGVALCQTAIVLKTGATANGRLLAETAVTLDANAVAQPAAGSVAPGSIMGTVRDMGAPAANALVLLRRGSAGSAVLDSVRTDADGLYAFAGLAPGTPDYRITATTELGTSTHGGLAVAAGDTLTSDFNLTAARLRPAVAAAARAIRFVPMGDRMAVLLGASASARSVSIFGLDGMVRSRIPVPAGQARVDVPTSLSPSRGFLFLVE